ncbi:MAG: oxidoreductase [Candidatus Methanomethylophilaceae archaeon]
MGFFSDMKAKRAEKKSAKACGCGCKDHKADSASKKADTEAKKTAPAAKKAAPAAADEFVANRPIDGYVPNLGAPKGGKIKIALYWAAACGGCDVSILDADEKVLNIGDMADIVMWPIAQDGKEHDIAAMKDGEITVSIINGAIRNTENESMVKLLRQKSVLVVSYGSCACFGGIPALANLVNDHKEILDYVYTKTPSTASFQEQCGHKNEPVIPQTSYKAPEGTLTLPTLYDTVKSLDQVIDVDYSIPGCPPTQESISQLLDALVGFVYNGVALPPKGTMIGVTDKTLCEECPRHKENRRITKINEPYEVDVDPDLCLMDQGILCLGPATVGGCGAKCTRVGQPCRGCYGPTKIVSEQGASMFTAVSSLFPVLDDDPNCGEDEIIDIMSSVKDPLGYFYAFTMSKALIRGKVKEGGQ